MKCKSNDFHSGLNQKSSGCNGTGKRGSPVSQGPVAGYNTLWVDGGPTFWGEFPKNIPFLITYKKGKRDLIIGMPKSRCVHQTLL